MTVIVWDGHTLAADKMSCNAELIRKVTKVRKIRGHACAVSGDWDNAQEVFDWFARGANPEDWPQFQRDDQKFVSFLVIAPDKSIFKYERSPYPMNYTEAGQYVMGSGRDYACAVLEMGGDAVKAVEITSKLCATCGLGVDAITPGD